MGKDKWNLGIKISYLERKYLMKDMRNTLSNFFKENSLKK
jgi:hypothetical protein